MLLCGERQVDNLRAGRQKVPRRQFADTQSRPSPTFPLRPPRSFALRPSPQPLPNTHYRKKGYTDPDELLRTFRENQKTEHTWGGATEGAKAELNKERWDVKKSSVRVEYVGEGVTNVTAEVLDEDYTLPEDVKYETKTIESAG